MFELHSIPEWYIWVMGVVSVVFILFVEWFVGK